jgi:hypothetical protein
LLLDLFLLCSNQHLLSLSLSASCILYWILNSFSFTWYSCFHSFHFIFIRFRQRLSPLNVHDKSNHRMATQWDLWLFCEHKWTHTRVELWFWFKHFWNVVNFTHSLKLLVNLIYSKHHMNCFILNSVNNKNIFFFKILQIKIIKFINLLFLILSISLLFIPRLTLINLW